MTVCAHLYSLAQLTSAGVARPCARQLAAWRSWRGCSAPSRKTRLRRRSSKVISKSMAAILPRLLKNGEQWLNC